MMLNNNNLIHNNNKEIKVSYHCQCNNNNKDKSNKKMQGFTLDTSDLDFNKISNLIINRINSNNKEDDTDMINIIVFNFKVNLIYQKFNNKSLNEFPINI